MAPPCRRRPPRRPHGRRAHAAPPRAPARGGGQRARRLRSMVRLILNHHRIHRWRLWGRVAGRLIVMRKQSSEKLYAPGTSGRRRCRGEPRRVRTAEQHAAARRVHVNIDHMRNHGGAGSKSIEYGTCKSETSERLVGEVGKVQSELGTFSLSCFGSVFVAGQNNQSFVRSRCR